MAEERIYFNIYFIGLFTSLLFVIIHISKQGFSLRRDTRGVTFFLAFLLFLYFGLRPFGFAYGNDTSRYVAMFLDEVGQIGNNLPIGTAKDMGFKYFMRLCAYFLSARGFLLAAAGLFLIPLIIAYRKMFGPKVLLPFFMLFCCFFFCSFGSGMIRSAIAYSFFLLFVCVKDNRLKVLFAALSFSFHASSALAIAVWAGLSIMGKWKIKYSIAVWFVCLTLAIVDLDFFSRMLGLMNLGELSTRATMYIDAAISYAVGFRTDFVLFSSFPIIIGLLFEKRGYGDSFSYKILNAYILLNAIFLLTMGVPYSDRYAVLSWSLIPIICSYPAVNHSNRRFYKLYLGICAVMTAITYYVMTN